MQILADWPLVDECYGTCWKGVLQLCLGNFSQLLRVVLHMPPQSATPNETCKPQRNIEKNKTCKRKTLYLNKTVQALKTNS